MRFLKVIAERDDLGTELEAIEKAQTRYLGFAGGYVLEIRDQPPAKSTDPAIALLEIHYDASDTGLYRVPDTTASQLAKFIEAATEPPAAPAAKPTANLGGLGIGLHG